MQRFEIEVDEKKYLVVAEWVKDTLWVFCQGQTWTIQKQDLLGTNKKRKKSQTSGLNLVSPMPGKVVKIFISAEQSVKAQQPVLVVEAMKMEHTLKATQDCQVVKIHIQLGTQVQQGQVLVEMKAP